jgi:high-affinity Fe2+/Pb2+ permease
MAEPSPPQRKQGKRTNLQWSVRFGLALGILFAVTLYFVLGNPSLRSFYDQWWPGIYLG